MSHVYEGLWVDWSLGLISGATLTLGRESGAVLAAALPVFVTLAGGGFWYLIRFATHQARAASVDPNDVDSSQGHDGLYCQQQAVLRNAETPLGAAWTMTKMTWAWRNAGIGSLSRSLLFLVSAALIYISFAAASILTAQAQSAATTNVLIIGTECGLWNFTGEPGVAGPEMTAKMLAQTRSATSYARNCYGSNIERMQCDQFTSQAIGYSVDPKAKCPFADGMCIGGSDAAMKMDTGLIDSNIDLGINAPSMQRLQVQKVATCSPLNMTGYQRSTSEVVGSPPHSWNDTFVENLLGPNFDNDYTYRYNLHGIYDEVSGYTLNAETFSAGATSNAWSPISEIRPEDAALTVLFLGSDHILYFSPVTDPFFLADVQDLPVNDPDPPYYVGDHSITALACLDQYRFCNPSVPDSCTPLTSLPKVLDAVHDIGLSDWQKGTAVRIAFYLVSSSIYGSVNQRGAAALMASDTIIVGGIQPSLPSRQYELELMNWFNISLARLQQGVVEYASGPSQLGTTGSVYIDNSLIERGLCHSQKIRSPKGYYNFSALGVGIIVGAGSILIILGFNVDTIVGTVKRCIHRGEYSSMAWALDEKLQLQRMAYEGHGWSGWNHNDDSVPFMTRGRSIGRYTGAGRHPTIDAPSSNGPKEQHLPLI